MGCNPCCCFSLKDSAVTIGIWTAVYSIASLFLFGWQTAVLNNCRSVTMAQANLQCEWDCPCVGASTSRTTSIIEGLFVIQILCLISVFFLLFASIALIYGVHTWSRYLVWPWFPCIISSILSSLAYCIMWWAGDVRGYWLALTILEMIGVFINVYCVVVVLMYYRRITSATDQYEGKDRRVRYKVNRNGYSSRRDLLQSHDGLHEASHQNIKTPYPTFDQPVRQSYPSPYSPQGVPQTPIPLPPNYTPYPRDINEVMAYPHEPQRPVAYEPPIEDPVSHWVRSQQKLDRGEANSEPISPSREVAPTFPMQHARSVPSLFEDTLVSHRDCRHRKHHHRSSSRRRRSKSRHYDESIGPSAYSSDSESRADFGRRDGSRRRHRSRPRYSESEITATTDHRHRHDRHRDDRDDDRRKPRHDRDRESRRGRPEKERRDERRDVRRDDRRDPRREERRDDDDARSSRRRRRHEEKEREQRPPSPEAEPEDLNPLRGGITIPQHIVIPPSNGERGPDGNPLPQKFQINSEITINYDQNGSPRNEAPPLAPDPRRRPMQITSNV